MLRLLCKCYECLRLLTNGLANVRNLLMNDTKVLPTLSLPRHFSTNDANIWYRDVCMQYENNPVNGFWDIVRKRNTDAQTYDQTWWLQYLKCTYEWCKCFILPTLPMPCHFLTNDANIWWRDCDWYKKGANLQLGSLLEKINNTSEF